jgi:WD40 repeat protein
MTLTRIALGAVGGAALLGLAALALGPVLPGDARDGSEIEPVRPALVLSTPDGLAIRLPGSAEPLAVPGSMPGDTAPALSPDGRQLALSRGRLGRGEIVVLDLWTSATRRLTTNPRAVDTAPAWSPDGRRIAWASGAPGAFDLFAMDADGRHKRRLVVGPGNDVDPTWRPDGRAIAFASDREAASYDLWSVPAAGGAAAPLLQAPGDQRGPVWSPGGGRIAFSGETRGNVDVWVVPTGAAVPRRVTAGRAFDGRPAWSPDGQGLAFVSDRRGAAAVWTVAPDGSEPRELVPATLGAAVDWGLALPGPRPLPTERLPDLDQRAPSGLLITRSRGRVRLGFASAVDNVGTGPVHVKGIRSPPERLMRADQLVELSSGLRRRYREVGAVEYTPHPPHYHWHYQPFERYELRRVTDHELLSRDHKTGFCLADHYGLAAHRVGGIRPPRFLGDCGKGRPELTAVEQGSSRGYTDRYPAFFHGQDVDITGLRPGLYVLVHRANPERLLHELRYDNNAASVLIRLSRPSARGALPAVTVLRRCEGSERCPPAPKTP